MSWLSVEEILIDAEYSTTKNIVGLMIPRPPSLLVRQGTHELSHMVVLYQ